MSDLQCPAVIVVLTPETIVDCDLRAHRLSEVIVGSSLEEPSAAHQLAAQHGCRVESAQIADAAALEARIEELADLYRGEAVAIVADAGVVCGAFERAEPPVRPIVISVDSDAWNLLSS